MKKHLLLFSALAICFNATAQLTSNYPPSSAVVSVGSYLDLGTNGTVISTPNNDDALSTAQPIGFTFTYNGSTFTDFILSTNGYIKLGNTPPSSAALFYTNPQTGAPTTSGGLFNSTNTADVNFLSPLCVDLVGATGVEYRVHTSGAVGSRVCTIQWKNVSDKNTPIPTQYSTMQFQVKLYETSNIIEFVYGTAVSSANASSFKAGIVGLKGASNAANQLIAVTKGSTQAWNQATFLSGNYTGNSFNFGNTNGTNRPLPVPGTTMTFVPVYPNDIGVLAVYTLGKIPKQYVTPQFVRARVKNAGTNAQSNVPVYLSVTGANTILDSVIIPSLSANAELTVSFPGFTQISNGFDTIRVWVPNDDNQLNQMKSNIQLVNDDVYSYADPTIPAAGGIGFTGATGQFCAKFPYAGIPNNINQIGVNFATGGVLLQIGLWSKSPVTGGPDTLVWSSNSFTSVSGLNTIPVNPPVSVSDTFFVGVRQISTTNASFAFQAEVPVRNQTFYYGTLNTSGTGWLDFANAGSNFRFMIEPRFQAPNDVGVTSIDYPCAIVPLGQGSLYPFATVFNYGLLNQTNVPVNCAIYLNNTVVYTSSTTASSVVSGSSQQVNFPTLFSPTVAGTYTIKTWSDLVGDASTGNDTASSTLQIVDYSTTTNADTRVQLDGVDDYMTISNNPILNPVNTFSVEGWFNPASTATTRTLVSKDSASTALCYNLTMNAGGTVSMTVNTNNGPATATSTTTLVTGNWYHIAGTYDGSNINLYINGALAGTALQTGSVTANNGPIYLGRTGGATPQYFTGGIEEVRIWSTARTAAQLRAGMHTSVAPFSDPNMVAYLRFDEGVSSFFAADASGNCNHGSLVNMDINNTTASPVWFISSVPMGAPIVATQTVTGSGPVTFTNANLSMNFANYAGSEDYYVHMFNAAPEGTQPSASPGGVTAVHPRAWIIYSYGTATYTGADATFELINNTLLPTAVPSDVKLFNRMVGSPFGWTLTQGTATGLNITPPTATYSFTSSSQLNQQFVIAGNNNPLPIKLISFDAKATNNDAQLSWQTSSEENTAKFIIERSADGIQYQEVAELKGRGNRYGTNDYSYVDKNVGLQHAKMQYRLKMIDYDGRFNYSQNRMVRFGKMGETLTVQPNPFRDQLTVSYYGEKDDVVDIIIADLQGKVLLKKSTNVGSGWNELNLQAGNQLSAGLYILTIRGGDKMYTYKVVKE